MTMPRLPRKRDAIRRLLACTTALALLFPALAAADDLVFAGPGDDWFDPENWIGRAVPGASDSATVEGATEALVFGAPATAGTLYVGRSADGALLVRDPLASESAAIGADAGASGAVTLSGTLGQWTNGGAIVAGDRGAGALSVTEGATVSAGSLTLGRSAGGAGTLTLHGAGSRLDLGGALEAGLAGDGAVSISAGAWLVSGGARLGALAGSRGSLTVDRLGSTFRSGSLTLGEAGVGTLAVTAGGVVEIGGAAMLGALAGGDGIAKVRGEGSLLSVAGTLTVGGEGTGALDLAEGGAATSLEARIGAAAGSSGAARLSGLGTRWTVTEHLGIGSGTLDIDTAASLSTGSATLGTLAGGIATATLSGGGTQWTNAGALAVGGAGDGLFVLDTGASVRTDTAVAGAAAGGAGRIRVDGSGSQLTVAGDFDVGRLGDGALDIVHGANASTGSLSAGTQAGGTGAVHVDGEGSSLTVAGDFDVGRFGAGSLTVSGGATVSAGAIVIAREAGSTGTLNIGAEETALAAGAGALETAAIRFGAGSGSLVLNHGETDYTLSAAISGTGTVKVLRGTTILTGDNSHDGRAVIASGATLSVGDGGATGTLGNGDVTNDGALVFDRSGAAAFSGAISGTGTLTKTGDGTLTLAGDSTYTGATTVREGRLDVDGQLASAVSVEDGAALGGRGTVGGAAVASGGTLAAEGLGITGDLALAAGSTLAARIGENGVEGVSVNGAATLDGAALTLGYEQGGALSNRYTLIEAGSLSGGFSSVTTSGLSSRFGVTETVGDDTATLDLVYDGSTATLTGTGARGVHAALGDAFNAGATLSGSLSTALAGDGADFQQAMTALSGEAGTSARIIGTLALDGFLRSAGEAGWHLPENERDAGLWARMTGENHAFERDAGRGVGAAETRLAGIEGGARFALDPVWTAGLALSLGRGRYESEDTAASATGRYAQAALHASGHFAGGAYISAALGAGLTDTETRRSLGVGDRVEGDFTARAAGFDLEGGRRFDFGDFALTPFAGASLIHSHAPAYTETAVAGTGNPALSYHSFDQWTGTVRAGLDAAYGASVAGRALSLHARLAYLHRFSGDGTARASFAALPGSHFDLESLTREGGAVAVSAGAALALGPQADLRIDLGGEWGARESGFAGKLGFNFQW